MVAVEMMMNQKVETVVLVEEQTLQVAMEVLLGLVEET